MQELRCRTDSRMIERSRLASFPELARLVSSPQETNRTFVSTATTTTRKHNAYGWHRRASLRSACRPCGQARTTRSSPRCSRDVRDPDATSTSRARSARRWRLDRHGQRSCHIGRWCAILGTLLVDADCTPRHQLGGSRLRAGPKVLGSAAGFRESTEMTLMAAMPETGRSLSDRSSSRPYDRRRCRYLVGHHIDG